MIDVSETYLNLSHQHFLPKLKKKRIHVKMVDLFAPFLTNCQAIAKIEKYATPKLSINLGL